MRADNHKQEPEQQDAEDVDEEDEDLPGDEPEVDKTAAAVRLNAIVGAATFLSNADPIYKEKMVLIVKKEFSEYSGYVSVYTRIKNT